MKNENNNALYTCVFNFVDFTFMYFIKNNGYSGYSNG
jgi:hypothetical protein